RVLERQLDVVEPRLLQRADALLVQPDAGGDQVHVVAERVRLRDDLLEVVARERLASGETELHGAERTRLAQHAEPVVRRKLGPRRPHVDRVVAEHAVQRAAIRELAEEPERRTDCRLFERLRLHRVHARASSETSSSQFFSSANSTNAFTSPSSPVAPYTASRSAT